MERCAQAVDCQTCITSKCQSDLQKMYLKKTDTVYNINVCLTHAVVLHSVAVSVLSREAVLDSNVKVTWVLGVGFAFQGAGNHLPSTDGQRIFQVEHL